MRLQKENSLLKEILRLDQAWSLKDVLAKLAEASNILLLEKDYDGHGWELISHCVDESKLILLIIQNIQNEIL